MDAPTHYFDPPWPHPIPLNHKRHDQTSADPLDKSGKTERLRHSVQMSRMAVVAILANKHDPGGPSINPDALVEQVAYCRNNYYEVTKKHARDAALSGRHDRRDALHCAEFVVDYDSDGDGNPVLWLIGVRFDRSAKTGKRFTAVMMPVTAYYRGGKFLQPIPVSRDLKKMKF